MVSFCSFAAESTYLMFDYVYFRISFFVPFFFMSSSLIDLISDLATLKFALLRFRWLVTFLEAWKNNCLTLLVETGIAWLCTTWLVSNSPPWFLDLEEIGLTDVLPKIPLRYESSDDVYCCNLFFLGLADFAAVWLYSFSSPICTDSVLFFFPVAFFFGLVYRPFFGARLFSKRLSCIVRNDSWVMFIMELFNLPCFTLPCDINLLLVLSSSTLSTVTCLLFSLAFRLRLSFGFGFKLEVLWLPPISGGDSPLLNCLALRFPTLTPFCRRLTWANLSRVLNLWISSKSQFSLSSNIFS